MFGWLLHAPLLIVFNYSTTRCKSRDIWYCILTVLWHKSNSSIKISQLAEGKTYSIDEVEICSMQWLSWQMFKNLQKNTFDGVIFLLIVQASQWLCWKEFHGRCFLKSLVKYSRAVISQSTSEWLLLIIIFQWWKFRRELLFSCAPLIKGTLLALLNQCVRNASTDGCFWFIYLLRKHAWQQGWSCLRDYFEMWSIMLRNCLRTSFKLDMRLVITIF